MAANQVLSCYPGDDPGPGGGAGEEWGWGSDGEEEMVLVTTKLGRSGGAGPRSLPVCLASWTPNLSHANQTTSRHTPPPAYGDLIIPLTRTDVRQVPKGLESLLNLCHSWCTDQIICGNEGIVPKHDIFDI